MISKSGAEVVPIFFEGANSRLFQVASHLHTTLRMALLIKEFKRRTDEPVKVVVGEPIPPEFSRGEVVDVLREYYDGLGRQASD